MADLQTRIKILLEAKGAETSIGNLKKEMSLLRKEIDKAEVGSDKYNAAVKRLAEANSILDTHRAKLKDTGGILSDLTKGATLFAGAMGVQFGVEGITALGTKLFNTATSMEALEKKAKTVFGETLPQATAAAKEHAAAMGLTDAEYIRAAANIADLLVPMGFQRQEATNIATEMTNLSGALSEWTGGQQSATQVAETLQAAILGEREGLKALGISISEEDVKARLAQKGLAGLTGEMLQQAKAAATLELVMEKSADAQAAYADGAGSIQRQTAEMTARFNTIVERLSTALIPVFSRLLEYALPIVDTFGDIIEAVTGTGEAAKSTSPTIQLLGDLFANIWEKLKAVGGIMFQVAKFIINNFTPVFYGIAGVVILAQNAIAGVINTLADFTGSEFKVKPLDIDLAVKSIDELKNKINSVDASNLFGGGGPEPTGTATTTTTKRQGSGGGAAPTAAAAKPTDNRQAERDAKDAEAAAALLAKERAIQDSLRALRASFLEEDLADAQAGFLELSALEAEQLALQLEGEAERDLLEDQKKQEAQALLLAATQTEYEAERETLRLHYEQLLQLAEMYGLDTTALRAKYAAEVTAIEKTESDKTIAQRQKELQAQVQMFSEFGNVVTDFATQLGEATGKANAAQKVATLAQIGVDTASAISSMAAGAEAAGAATGPLAPVTSALFYASGLLRVLNNFKKAKELLQKADGGWNTVTGMQDHRTYHAKYIGRPGTGMLNHPHPVILANERGPEYYVDNDTLRNPAAFAHVQAIENIKRNRGLLQRATGGFNTDTIATGTTTGTTPTSGVSTQAIAAMQQLLDILQSGRIYAVVEDNTILDIQQRTTKLNNARGN